MLKINYGCGERYLDGFINIDQTDKVKSDLIHDLTKGPFTYEDNSVDVIYMIHSLEHIELIYWDRIFSEFNRVLKIGGELLLGYPEFERCAYNYTHNIKGMKDFWRWTLYGCQRYPGDFHVVPMESKEIENILKQFNFVNFNIQPDDDEDYNSWLMCFKGEKQMTREDLLRNEVFGGPTLKFA